MKNKCPRKMIENLNKAKITPTYASNVTGYTTVVHYRRWLMTYVLVSDVLC